MKEEPDIVKELREEERLGKLGKKQDNLFYFQQVEGRESYLEGGISEEDIEVFSRNKLESIKQNYLSFFENCLIAITIADNNGHIILWNKYAEELFKMNEKDLFLRNVKTLYPPEEWEKIKRENIRQKGLKHKMDIRMVKNDGKIFDAEISICILKGEMGKITGSIAFIKDNSKLKEIERKLIDTEEKYKTIFDNSAVAIMLTNKDEQIISWNKYTEMLLEMEAENLYLKPVKDLYPYEEWEKIKAQNIRQKGMQHHLETKMFRGDKKLIDVDISISILKDHKGEIVGSIGVIKDITDRKIIENALIESEKKFRGIFDASSDFILYLQDNRILDINQSALKLIGLKKEEILGRSIEELKKVFSESDIKKHLRAIENAYQNIKIDDYECDIKSSLGENYRFLFSIDCLKGENEISGIILRGKDITQRQLAWEELVKLEERYRILAETSADGVVTIDKMGRLTYVNPSFERMIGLKKGQILATPFRNYVSEDYVYFFQQIFLEAFKSGKKIENVELELIRSNGSIVPVEVNLAPFKKKDEFVGIVFSIRDITERRKVENELKKSERLKTEFMNIAAHELKSPVTPIKGYLELVIADKDANERIKNWAKIALRNSERLLKLISDILDVSRLDTDTMRFEMTKLNITKVLEEVTEDMRIAIENKGLKFITKIPKDLPNVIGDRYRLAQVFKNLLGNALKFTDSGFISVEAEKKENYVLISIKDSGIGISKEEEKKIFNKFYQAYSGEDRKNEGVGLGLFICKEIVKKHNGDIWVESELKKGSTFFVKLPYVHKIVISKDEELGK